MGIELLEIGVKIRKFVILLLRGCFRSVCNHPFLVGFLCFLILLYRSSPFIFSLLVSASPILICTAVLLGVLLSYGEPNIPEIEIEEKNTTFTAASLRTEGLGHSSVVEQNGSYVVERFSEKRADLSDDTDPLIKEGSQEIESNGGELSDSELKNKWIGEEKLTVEVLESDDDKSETDSFDSEKVNVDSLDSPPRSPWKRIEDCEGNGDEEERVGDDDGSDRAGDDVDSYRAEDDDGSDFGSDRAESSSPDASMADIMPMLDELHPLLEDENPQPVHGSHSGSDEESWEKSSKSSAKSRDSDDESEENQDDLETQDDYNEDARGENEDRKKSIITWTEEDEKNLMHLGSSEIERNQRLENLILRRRAKKNISMVTERNLIDLESIDYPLGLAPISTRKQNPFDLPQDSYDNNSVLPPIPGSAPSVLSQRRNPFDIPYDSTEEKPDLMGDGFKEEFTTSFQSREALFSRHESFNVGPSVFAPDRKDVRMRPYFVPESAVLEESSYSLYQRQSSELSESKVSSVPETESICSVEDLEDKKLWDNDNRQEEEVFVGSLGDQQTISHQEEEENVNREPELISEIGNVSEHVGHGSQSSEDEESLELDQVEKREVHVDEHEVELEDVADHYRQESVTGPVQVQAINYEQVYRRDSSSSSLPEVSEQVLTEAEGEGLSMLEERRDVIGILAQTSTGSANTLVIGVPPQRAPVYDSSPRGIEIDISSSSISSVLILPETSTDHSVDESRPMDAVHIRGCDNVNTDSSDVLKESEREGISAESGIISDVSIPLEVSVEGSVEENLVEEQVLDEVSGLRADGSIRFVDKSSEEQLEVSEPLLEGQLRGGHKIGIEERETDQLPDSDDDEKLISMSSVYDAKEIHETNSQHIEEAQASNSLIESSKDVQITPNFNMPEVQELYRDIPSNINFPFSPEFIFGPLGADEPADSHVTEQTTVEELDGIKGIDEELLSELDNVGDFSVGQWGSGSSELEKRIGSVEESFAYQIEISTTAGVADDDSVKENVIEDSVILEMPGEVIDIYEEDVEYNSELKTSKASSEEHIDLYDRETSENETVPKESEARPVNCAVSHDYEDKICEIPELEVQSGEDELASPQTEITYQGQVDRETTSQMHELEASKIEGINLAIEETTFEEFNGKDGQDSSNNKTCENEKLSTEIEARPVHSVARNDHYEDNISEITELEVQSKEKDVDFVSEKDESTSLETGITCKGQVDIEAPFEMVELEVSKLDDSDLPIKEPVVLEPPHAKETLAECSKNKASEENSSATGPTGETSILEVRPVGKDATSDCERSISDSAVHAQGLSSELNFSENVPSEGITSLPPNDKVLNGNSLEDDELVEVEAVEVGSSVAGSRVQEIGVVAERQDHEVEENKDLHSALSDKGRGKISRSSSSSSSSDSSSSDSERD